MEANLNNIEYTAYMLAYKFTTESEKPWRGDTRKKIEYELFITSMPDMEKFKKVLDKELQRTSKLEKRYIEYVEEWKQTIGSLIQYFEKDQATRILSQKPYIEDTCQHSVYCKDFSELNLYLHNRKLDHTCSDAEVGCLSTLLTEIQRVIEYEISMKETLSNTNFVSIDFEHATPEKGTICSVGIVSIENGLITDTFSSLIQPPNNEYFSYNSTIHGIFETDTYNAPSFIEVWPEIKKRIANKTVIAHGAMHTERHCLMQALNINNIDEDLNINWIDTQEICPAKLEVICNVCKIELQHHNALSDAMACAKIYLLWIADLLPLESILFENQKEIKDRIADFRENHQPIEKRLLFPEFETVTNKDNPFFQKKVVISGTFDYWPDRNDLAIKMQSLGADIDRGVGKYTQILCAGHGCGPSKKQQMQDLIANGKDAKILNEQQIIELLTQCGELDN